MTPLFGHEEAIAAFRAGLETGRLHHAWLIAGPEGIGKGLFARKAALRLIAEGQAPVGAPGLDVPDFHPAARLFNAENHPHPDFHLVQREIWDPAKKDTSKKDALLPHEKRKGDEERARSIRVSQIRWLRESLGGTTSLSARRAVVIDAIDDLEPPAANALLKSLEEPPASTIFLLVSHAPERLLPTIRSRCRMLRLSPLGRQDMEAALREALPGATAPEVSALANVGEGSPGRASAFRGLDVPGLDAAIRIIAQSGDQTMRHRSDLASGLSQKGAQPRYEAFLTRAPSFIAAEAKRRQGADLAHALDLWERASKLSVTALRQSLDVQAAVFEMGTLLSGLSARA